MWLATVERAVVRPDAVEPQLVGGDVTITHFAQDGSAVRAGAEALGPWRSAAELPLRTFQTEDLDGDGEAELVFAPAEDVARTLHVLTFRGGVVHALPLPTSIRADQCVDVDGDHQRDLVERVAFELPRACATEGFEPSLQAAQWIALREGSAYQVDGDRARAWMRLQCPEAPSTFVPTQPLTREIAATALRETVRRIACGRVWGMSAQAISRTFPAAWPAAWACVRRDQLISWADSLRAPLTLSALAGVLPPRAGADAHVASIDAGDFALLPASASAAGNAVRRACATNEASAQRAIASLARASHGALTQERLDDLFGAFGQCRLSAGRDAWANTITSLRWSDDRVNDPGIEGVSRLAHIDDAGRIALAPTTPLRHFSTSHESESIEGSFDYDGDGSTEVVTARVESNNRTSPIVSLAIRTMRAGRVERYEPAGGVPAFSGLVDFDRDGRPDLYQLFCTPFEQRSSGVTLYGPRCLAHARPDGTFSTDDAVAQSFVRAQCTAPPERLVVLDARSGSVDRDATLSAIACARFYGESAERAVHRVALESRGLDDGDVAVLRDLALAALWRAPYILTAPVARTTQHRASSADAGARPSPSIR